MSEGHALLDQGASFRKALRRGDGESQVEHGLGKTARVSHLSIAGDALFKQRGRDLIVTLAQGQFAGGAQGSGSRCCPLAALG